MCVQECGFGDRVVDVDAVGSVPLCSLGDWVLVFVQQAYSQSGRVHMPLHFSASCQQREMNHSVVAEKFIYFPSRNL